MVRVKTHPTELLCGDFRLEGVGDPRQQGRDIGGFQGGNLRRTDGAQLGAAQGGGLSGGVGRRSLLGDRHEVDLVDVVRRDRIDDGIVVDVRSLSYDVAPSQFLRGDDYTGYLASLSSSPSGSETPVVHPGRDTIDVIALTLHVIDDNTDDDNGECVSLCYTGDHIGNQCTR